MANEWEIKSRGHHCTVTERRFEDGETFYTLLFREGEGFTREDLCIDAWKERDRERTPFSSWKSKYEIPPPPPPEPLGKQTAEDLLRRYMNEPGHQHTNVRYILALMLERKRLLKPIEVKEQDGQKLLIYEHRATGEVFVVPDPCLRLDQIESVQEEVGDLLSSPPPMAEPEPELDSEGEPGVDAEKQLEPADEAETQTEPLEETDGTSPPHEESDEPQPSEESV